MKFHWETKGIRVILRYQVAVTFAIDGDLRFISHLDTLRLFARAVTRAQLPVRFSEGFNPQPKLWLPLPRPVGMAADREMLVVQFSEPVAPVTVREKLEPQMPDGITFVDVAAPTTTKVLQASQVSYRLGIDPNEQPRLAQAADRLLHAGIVTVLRRYGPGKPARTIDIRRNIARIQVSHDCLEFTLTVAPDGTARPAEVIEAIGLDPNRVAHRMRRTRILWA